eukprot:scaffold114268_cov37-Cyclotella_meneghiniana.AAC.2
MYNTDPITLTNQPETGAIPSLTLSRAAGCQEVGANVVLDEYWPAEVDESEVLVFGRVGDNRAKLPEVEAAMTPALLRIMALGPGGVAAAGGWSISLLFSRYWPPW